MKEIKMRFNGAETTFQVAYECPQYIFCECKINPANRGFFTAGYVAQNKL